MKSEAERIAELEEMFKGTGEVLTIVRPLICEQVRTERELAAVETVLLTARSGAVKVEARKRHERLLTQLLNVTRTLTGILRKDAAEEVSPLRAYLERLGNEEANEDGQAD